MAVHSTLIVSETTGKRNPVWSADLFPARHLEWLPAERGRLTAGQVPPSLLLPRAWFTLGASRPRSLPPSSSLGPGSRWMREASCPRAGSRWVRQASRQWITVWRFSKHIRSSFDAPQLPWIGDTDTIWSLVTGSRSKFRVNMIWGCGLAIRAPAT